jgi:hypothetical protein
MKHTGVVGMRLKEFVAINCGLLTLGCVMKYHSPVAIILLMPFLAMPSFHRPSMSL